MFWSSGGVCDGIVNLVFNYHLCMLEAQMRAQRVDAAVGGRAVRAHAALRRVRVVVVPAVGHLLAA